MNNIGNNEQRAPERLGCTLDVPYPPVTGVRSDCRLAGKLAKVYAGQNSELSTISQYLYQSILLDGVNCRAASMLECISGVEMRHFKLLGQLIYTLGSNPVLRIDCRSAGNGWWSGSYPSYTGELCSMINANIASEQESIRRYNNIIHMTADRAVIDIIERIILDERHHLELFTMIRSHCC